MTGFLLFIRLLWAVAYAFSVDSALNQVFCMFRDYLLVVLGRGDCASYTLQTVSRLFSGVFYRHRYLLTNRLHVELIAGSWSHAILIPLSLVPLHGFTFQAESRMCFIT